MSRIFEFIKLYASPSKYKYLYLSLELVVFCFIFHLVFNNVGEIKLIKQTLERAGASHLYLAEMTISDMNNLSKKLAVLQKKLPYGIEMISPSKKLAFTDQLQGNQQITVDFLSRNEIKQYKYLISKGDYFQDIDDSEKIYPTIVPKKLSNKYELGKAYNITINKNLMSLQSIKIKIIGVRNDNYILEHTYGNPNIYRGDSTILVFDRIGEISKLFYSEFDGSVSIMFENTRPYSEGVFTSFLEDMGLKNINNLEENILMLKGLTYKDLYIYLTLLIVIFPLIVVSISSFFYLEFHNRKSELFILKNCGIDVKFYFQSMYIMNLAFFLVPVILQEIVWFLICSGYGIRYFWLHCLLILALCFVTVTLITSFNSYFFKKVNYDDKSLDKEIICE